MSINANYNKSSKKNPTQKLNTGKDAVFGIYLAEVVSTKDISRTGRCRVFIPAISKDKNSTAGYFDAIWTSPFAGTTDPRAVGTDINLPEQSMSSYGFWATVPDNGNLVLVAFGDGNTKYPLVISCLFGDKFNFMIPGQAGNKSYQSPNIELPVVEKNKRTEDINHNDTFRPIQHTLSEGIVRQGLARDPIRGAGKATARRESPSEVFGLLTPGPRDPDNFNYRLGGHSITLDDNLGSRQIRIRSAQGSQLLLDDTSGMIYMINRDGTVWMEFSQTGDVFLYGEGDINLRAKKNFNLRADQNINLEAGQDINIKAAKDFDGEQYLGDGSGAGGNIRMQALAEMHLQAEFNTFQTSMQGEHHINAAGQIGVTTGNKYSLKAASDIEQAAGAGFSTKASSAIVLTTGANFVAKGSQILLNSGGPDARDPAEALVATPTATNQKFDQPKDAPTYDRAAESPVTSGGIRSGSGAEMQSIVGVLVTAEPFAGHGIPNPVNDDQDSMVPDESVSQGLNPNSNGLSNSPADVNTPDGLAQGSYDENGNPVYTNPSQFTNNFTIAKNKQNTDQLISQLNASLNSSIPTVRQPTMSPQGAMKLGMNGTITNIQNNAKQLAFDVKGMPADLSKGELRSMSNRISAARTQYPDPQQQAEALLAQGIQTQQFGQETIYVGANGNKVVTFDTGLGNVGNAMLTQANLRNTEGTVKQLITRSLSDNQYLAMISLANHIGVENFAKSKVLGAVNSGNFAIVPFLLTAHSSLMQGGVPTFQMAHYQRRQYEGELFQTPDIIKLPSFLSRVTFEEQAKWLYSQRNNLLLTGGLSL